MTAINAPLTQGADRAAFRRGLLGGAVASALLALAMTAAAFASGLVQPSDTTVPAAPDQAAPDRPQIDENNPLQKGRIQLY